METARLRIKFTPLLQNMRNTNSKCCLQIIPEVTCMQNLDKIEWKQNNNFMEYVIPMTYKIILKKHQKQTDNNEITSKTDKTYHSCVDLLLPSMSSMDLGCGDIVRMISDTLLFSKLTDKTDFKKNCIFTTKLESNRQELEPVVKYIDSEIQRLEELDDECQVNDASALVMNIKHVCTSSCSVEEVDKDCQVPDYISASTDPEYLNLLNKVTNTDSVTSIDDHFNLSSIPTITKTYTKAFKSANKEESKRKLSVTPICSINTVDNVVNTVTAVISNTVICRLYDSQTNNIKIVTSDSFSNTTNGNSLGSGKGSPLELKQLKKIDYFSHDLTLPEDIRTPRRILPEVRISMFMRLMKHEIMPLQEMLNDILQKCSTLGLKGDNKVFRTQKSIFYKNIPECGGRVKQSTRQKQSKSNRVVYSIVFDD